MYIYLKVRHCHERGNKQETVIIEMPEETALQAHYLLGAKFGLFLAGEIIQVRLSNSLDPEYDYRKYPSFAHFCIAAQTITWEKD
jgi:hypothetical protein